MSNRWLAPEDHGLSFPHPSAPLLVATNASWKRWKKDDAELGQAFEGVLGEGSADDATGFALPGFEQGRIWIAAAEDAVWIVHWFGPEDDAGPSTAWRMSTTHTEYLAGTFTVPKGGASVGDAWHEARWPLPLPPGKYVVLEGQDDDRASWLRVLVGRAADHVARPAPPAQEPSAEELAQARIETLLTMRVEGKRLSTGPLPPSRCAPSFCSVQARSSRLGLPNSKRAHRSVRAGCACWHAARAVSRRARRCERWSAHGWPQRPRPTRPTKCCSAASCSPPSKAATSSPICANGWLMRPIPRCTWPTVTSSERTRLLAPHRRGPGGDALSPPSWPSTDADPARRRGA